MPSDNVDIFKKVIFRIPSTGKILGLINLIGLISGISFYLSLKLFAGNLIDVSLLDPLLSLFLAIFLFTLPTMLSGELFFRFLPDYPRKWGYFLALSTQVILLIYSLILSGANNFANAWNVLWLGITTIYLTNLLVLLLTIGYQKITRVAVLSAVQPLLVLVFFHFFLGRFLQIPLEIYLLNLMVPGFAALLLMIGLGITEYLLKSNVGGVSVLNLTSGLLQKKQEALDLGHPTDVDVQTLEIENEDERLRFAIPWIHPGPLEGFGGGEISSRLIEKLNRDESGFFLHVPSSHQSDPAEPDASEKIFNAIEAPEKVESASRLLRKETEDAVFYGRRFNGKKMVYIDTEEYDDYEISIFAESIDMENTTVIDLHSDNEDERREERKELWYNTRDARRLRDQLESFIEELDSLELEEYSAGFEVKSLESPVIAFVERSGEQEVLFLGIESNGVPESMRETREMYREDFDQVILFTTDTHQSIHDLSSRTDLDAGDVADMVERAREKVSSARIGLGLSKAEDINLLQEDYNGLIFSINILVRLLPLTLILLYLALVIWIF